MIKIINESHFPQTKKNNKKTRKNCPMCGANLIFIKGYEICLQCSYCVSH